MESLNKILVGDCITTMRTLPADMFHCCVTSPPYWNLRSYLPSDHPDKAQEIGSERTLAEFVETMVSVFREVRRVLRDDGTLWLNLGDSYAQDTKWGGTTGGKHAKGLHGTTGIGRNRTNSGLDAGSVCNIPNKVAEALRADGWLWRSTIIWAKRNAMPESVSGWRWMKCRVKAGSFWTEDNPHPSKRDGGRNCGVQNSGGWDTAAKWLPCPGCKKCLPNGGYVLRRGKWRPTTAHEYVFMFSKSERYFCDGDAVQETAVGGTPGNKSHKGLVAYLEGDDKHRTKVGLANMVASEKRNPRSVWLLSSEPYKGSHFATFPSELARRCIAASTSKAGCCAACGAGYAPVVESERVATRPGENTKVPGRNSRFFQERDQNHPGEYKADRYDLEVGNRDPQRHVAVSRVTGYRPTCNCQQAEPVPCRVLDCFGGSGTVGQVAKHMGRDYVLCELNPLYVPLIEQRVDTPPRCLAKLNGKVKRTKPAPEQMELFA